MRVGMKLVQGSTFSASLTQGGFTKNLQPLPTTPKLWAARQHLLSPEDDRLRQRMPGELCWLATASRPDISARLAHIAYHINSLEGSDVYSINGLIKTAKEWQKAAVLKNDSSSQLGTVCEGPGGVKMRERKEKIRGITMTLVGWSDAAYGERSNLGKCRLGYVIGLMSSTLSGLCHIIQWASKFTRKLVKSSQGGKVYAFSEMIAHMSVLRKFYGHLSGYGRR